MSPPTPSPKTKTSALDTFFETSRGLIRQVSSKDSVIADLRKEIAELKRNPSMPKNYAQNSNPETPMTYSNKPAKRRPTSDAPVPAVDKVEDVSESEPTDALHRNVKSGFSIQGDQKHILFQHRKITELETEIQRLKKLDEKRIQDERVLRRQLDAYNELKETLETQVIKDDAIRRETLDQHRKELASLKKTVQKREKDLLQCRKDSKKNETRVLQQETTIKECRKTIDEKEGRLLEARETIKTKETALTKATESLWSLQRLHEAESAKLNGVVQEKEHALKEATDTIKSVRAHYEAETERRGTSTQRNEELIGEATVALEPIVTNHRSKPKTSKPRPTEAQANSSEQRPTSRKRARDDEKPSYDHLKLMDRLKFKTPAGREELNEFAPQLGNVFAQSLADLCRGKAQQIEKFFTLHDRTNCLGAFTRQQMSRFVSGKEFACKHGVAYA